eukprot:833246-Pelagomonas_calceolata.AAC.2
MFTRLQWDLTFNQCALVLKAPIHFSKAAHIGRRYFCSSKATLVGRQKEKKKSLCSPEAACIKGRFPN